MSLDEISWEAGMQGKVIISQRVLDLAAAAAADDEAAC